MDGSSEHEGENGAQILQESLQDFVMRVGWSDQIVGYYEQYHLSTQMMRTYETRIIEANTIPKVVEVVKEMFETLMSQILAHTTLKSKDVNFSELGEDEQNERENLERVVEKYQAEIKNHIKIQKELEKMTFELSGKLEKMTSQLKKNFDYIGVCNLHPETGEGLQEFGKKKRQTGDCKHRLKETNRVLQAPEDLPGVLPIQQGFQIQEKLKKSSTAA